MTVEITAIDSFVHGNYMLAKGQKQQMPQSVAEDLAKVGLVTLPTKQSPAPANKMDDAAANKAAAPAKSKK